MSPSVSEPVPSRSARRVAFVGQRTYFEACALDREAPGIAAVGFLEFRAGGDAERMLGELQAFGPDVVVVFRPEIVPPGLFEELAALTLGFLTEPLPRSAGRRAVAPDLVRRRRDLLALDASNFDRVVAFDPNIVGAAEEFVPIWRSLPLPVGDRYFRDVRAPTSEAQPLFVGRSTEHRERMLIDAKHRHDVLHLAFGVHADMLEGLLDAAWLGLNVHNDRYPSFENRVCLHLAAGHLVLSEPLDPLHGLEPDVDFLEVRSPEHLLATLEEALAEPGLHQSVRVRGRAKAELYRASSVWSRVVEDLVADVATFGSSRGRP